MGLQWYLVIGYHMMGLPGAFYIACVRTFLCMAHDFCAQKAILGPPPPPPQPPLTPTKVFKVEYRHEIVVGNTWLGSNMLVGGYYIGPKMAVCCSCARFLCI